MEALNTLRVKVLGVFIITILSSFAFADNSAVQEGEHIRIRTGSLGDTKIAAFRDSGEVLAIVCYRHMVTANKADLVFPNERGTVAIDSYNHNSINKFGPAPETSPYVPLDSAAMSAICNKPNGQYQLVVKIINNVKTATLEGTQLVNTQFADAGRGF